MRYHGQRDTRCGSPGVSRRGATEEPVMFHSFEEAQSLVRENAIAMVDLKFCDLWGRWHHVTVPAPRFAPALMEKGVGFDGSSVGFKAVSAGDMGMVPDLETGFVDP